jgi:hypothetical protein
LVLKFYFEMDNIRSMLEKIKQKEDKEKPFAVIERVGNQILFELDCRFEDFLNHNEVTFSFPSEDCYFDRSEPTRILDEEDLKELSCPRTNLEEIRVLKHEILEYLNPLLAKLPFRVEISWNVDRYGCIEFTITK